jgi:hypothetical protein
MQLVQFVAVPLQLEHGDWQLIHSVPFVNSPTALQLDTHWIVDWPTLKKPPKQDKQFLVVTLHVKHGDSQNSHLLSTEVVPSGQVALHSPLSRLVPEEARQAVQLVNVPVQVEQFGVHAVQTRPLTVLTEILPAVHVPTHWPPYNDPVEQLVQLVAKFEQVAQVDEQLLQVEPEIKVPEGQLVRHPEL